MKPHIYDFGILNPAPSTDCLHKLRGPRGFLVLFNARGTAVLAQMNRDHS
jgi:hypothetical protein